MFNIFKKKQKIENNQEQKILKDLVIMAKSEGIKQYQVTITKLNDHKFKVVREEIKNVNLGNSSWESNFTNSATFYI